MFNLWLLLQRKHAEAAEYWRRYLANDSQSEWAARARRSLKFCEMCSFLIAGAITWAHNAWHSASTSYRRSNVRGWYA